MATQTKQEYKIDSRPLVPTPQIFQLHYDELGQEAVSLMNERFQGNRCIELDPSKLIKNQPINFCNIYRRYALGIAVRDITGWNTRPITPAESEIALKQGTLPGNPRDYYEDLGFALYPSFALYPKEEYNEELKQHLLNQSKANGLEVKLPAIATLLTPVLDDNDDFAYGARFDLGEFSEIYHAPVLAQQSGKFYKNDPGLIQRGVPDELGNGSRDLYIAYNGLRAFGRNSGLNLDANRGNLLGSYVVGRVNFLKFAEGDA